MNKKYRKAIIAGNWKMNKTASEVKPFVDELRAGMPKLRGCDAVICTPFPLIPTAAKAAKDIRGLFTGAQNVSEHASGAYTGEVSADMLRDLGVKYCIVGHSERREYFGETDALVNSKAKALLAADISPIICVGETLEQREKDLTLEFVAYQLKAALSGMTGSEVKKCIIAYEPIWAIGTGKTATADEADEVCHELRVMIRKSHGALVSRGVSILYGGSMNAKNAAELLGKPDIDGGLIGGASLKAPDFLSIIGAAAAGD